MGSLDLIELTEEPTWWLKFFRYLPIAVQSFYTLHQIFLKYSSSMLLLLLLRCPQYTKERHMSTSTYCVLKTQSGGIWIVYTVIEENKVFCNNSWYVPWISSTVSVAVGISLRAGKIGKKDNSTSEKISLGMKGAVVFGWLVGIVSIWASYLGRGAKHNLV